jgi:hypothetical protein
MDSAPSKEALNEAIGEVQSYLETSKEYVRLQVFKISMQLVTTMVKGLLLGVLGLLALLFLSFYAAQTIGSYLEGEYLGYLVVGGFYLLASAVAFIFRKRLEKPVLRHFSYLYFKS